VLNCFQVCPRQINNIDAFIKNRKPIPPHKSGNFFLGVKGHGNDEILWRSLIFGGFFSVIDNLIRPFTKE
jgi:hypothetical protein